MANVQAAVEAQLFGANVVGVVSRGKKDQKTITQFLVMPSEQQGNQAFTVDDVVKEINRTIYKLEHDGNEGSGSYNGPVKKDQINNALSIVGLNDAEFTFMQTFVYYKGEKADDQSEVKKHLEYAIGIHIKGNQDVAEEFHFLNVRDIYINVWDTEREKVLDRMNIWTLDQIGEDLGVEPA